MFVLKFFKKLDALLLSIFSKKCSLPLLFLVLTPYCGGKNNKKIAFVESAFECMSTAGNSRFPNNKSVWMIFKPPSINTRTFFLSSYKFITVFCSSITQSRV